MINENTPPRKEVTCEYCGDTFTPGWSDEERDAEYARNFADVEKDEPKLLVCDACYKIIMTFFNREVK